MQASVSAVIFAKDLKRMTAFYSQALGMSCSADDEHHAVLDCAGFNLTIHGIPGHGASESTATQSPVRRVEGAIRLSFPVRDMQEARRVAHRLGGCIDDVPPAWASPRANVFLGYDPEGNVFKVSEQSAVSKRS